MERTLSFNDESPQRMVFRAPALALAFRCDQPTASVHRLSLAEVDRARVGRGPETGWQRITESGKSTLAIQVADGWLSTRHVELTRIRQRWVLTDAGSKNGTFVNGAAATERTLEEGDVIEVGACAFVFRSECERDARQAPDHTIDTRALTPGSFVSLHQDLDRALQMIARSAASGLPLLIRGDTGTGKEVLARHAHNLSRRKGNFVGINCAAIPAELAEAELFGAVKGAYSGAVDRAGLFRSAHNGTLFLDEVAELSAPVQAKLLRVLQEREVRPVGSDRTTAVDVNVLAGSHASLDDAVIQGGFRQDLRARLAGVEIEIPPLAQRPEDLGLLIGVLLHRHFPDRATQLSFTRSAMRRLFAFDWPDNVRQLEQALVRSVHLCEGNAIGPEHLPGVRPEEDPIRTRLIAALRQHQGNISAVGRDLGKARVQIRRWCERYGVKPNDYR